MIIKLRKSKTLKAVSIFMAVNLFFDLVAPMGAFALTGGPAQPEFSSFTPVGTSDMVDLSSGDMNYNIPLVDVGGYPLNIAYSSGVGMDEEASWVGLGWNLSVGQINRNVRGIPDDFKGDEIRYENYVKPNITAGASFKFTPAAVGFELNAGKLVEGGAGESGNVTLGVSAMYNNYTGFSIKPSIGVQLDLGKNASVGFNAESGPDGLSVSPNLSIHAETKKKDNINNKLGINAGTSFNSRRGLSHMTMGVSRQKLYHNEKAKHESQKVKTLSSQSLGSSISFADQLYTPSRRVGMVTGSFTVNAALGAEVFGGEGQGQITAYGTVMKVKESEKSKLVNAYGYNHTDLANEYSILDFNREKDGAFSVNSTNLPLTNYTYDIYSVQGQGVSGMYRPFRNQVGYVYDARVEDGSTSGTFGFEAGTGNAFHAGIDIEVVNVKSHSGVWKDRNHAINHMKESYAYNPDYEKVHFKNVGDLSADRDPDVFDKIGRYQAVRIPFAGGKFNRKALSKYHYRTVGSNSENVIPINGKIKRSNRQFRNQTIYSLTYKDLAEGKGYGPLVQSDNHSPEVTLPAQRKPHHVGEVQIIRNDGARYVYGLSAYNNKKIEATFAVDVPVNCQTGLTTYTPSELDNPQNLPNDKYLNRITTPGYAHTHLLTSVLSTDYQDRDGDGPTPDDFGSYTKFSYVKKNENYKWRVPYLENHASGNEGFKTEKNDDQGNYVYGEKEQYYIDKIETKTHVAFFSYSPRKDGKGVQGEHGGMGPDQHSYKLDKISLYSVGEFDAQNPNASTPIKQVHFEYSYSLCPNVPNNDGGTATGNEKSNRKGKLTLKKIYFTYRNSLMGKYTGYKFNYGEYKPQVVSGTLVQQPDEYTPGINPSTLVLNTNYQGGGTALNPEYNLKGYDSWGNYLPNTGGCGNTDDITAPEFPFTNQDQTEQNRRSAVWSMKTISLPSGGTIDVTYESDDYAFIQDKNPMRMFKVAGTGGSPVGSASDLNPSQLSGALFGNQPLDAPRRYLYVEVDQGATNADVGQYLSGLKYTPIYFRFLMNTTQLGSTAGNEANAKFDYVTGYFQYENSSAAAPSQIFEYNNKKYLSIPVMYVKKEGGLGGSQKVHPISKATWHFGRKYLNKHVYSAQPNGDSEDIEAIVKKMVKPNSLSNLMEIFTGPNGALENKGIGKRFIKKKSWVRLNEPDRKKLGGGSRVKEIRMSDVWAKMNPTVSNYQTMRYGQQYEYTLENGMSSGVATYEPVGNKENPFVQPVFSTTKHLLAPDEQNFIERPFGESFFPSPQVTYSRVSVANVTAGTHPDASKQVKKLHKTGKVVTEFYTTKDYPTIVDQTKLQAKEDKQQALANILGLNVRKHFTASQGYVVHLNDMNGKQKSQRVYAEGQSDPISGVDYLYDNHTSPTGFNASASPEVNKGRLNNKVTVIEADGTVKEKTIGVETDIVNDFRENKTKSRIPGVNTNLATFFVGTFPGIVPLPLPDYAQSEDRFRSSSTTKVINTFGLLKETVAFDAGAEVYTRNLAWDANTGEVLVTETIDEFNDKYYTLNYPAHWFYDGMGQAAQNIGLKGTLTGSSGNYVAAGISTASNYFIPGDELYLSGSDKIAWVTGVSGNQIQLIDKNGVVLNSIVQNEQFEVVRSGHRNLQSAGIMNVTLMKNPLTNAAGNLIANLGGSYLITNNWANWRIINAGAVDYSDVWKAGCECIIDPRENTRNPYRFNERGVWRTKSSRTYLTGRNAHNSVTPRRDGFFNKFSPMYKLSGGGQWTKDFTGWTYVAEVTRYSPFGFELENKDALNRYSAAQYGYNNTFPIAVGANSKYNEIGFDGFEDRKYAGCPYNTHFNINAGGVVTTRYAHTGKHSIEVNGNSRATMTKKLVDCSDKGTTGGVKPVKKTSSATQSVQKSTTQKSQTLKIRK